MSMINVNLSGDNPKITDKRFWIKCLIMAIAILITCFLFPSIVKCDSVLSALLASVVISLLNAFLKPVLQLLSVPLMVFSLGLFSLVINAIIVLIASKVLGGFHIFGFGSAVLFSIIVTFLSFLLDLPQRIAHTKKNIEETLFGSHPQEKEEENKVQDTDYEEVSSTRGDDENNDK